MASKPLKQRRGERLRNAFRQEELTGFKLATQARVVEPPLDVDDEPQGSAGADSAQHKNTPIQEEDPVAGRQHA